MRDVRFEFEAPDYLNDVQDIVRGFYPFLRINPEADGFIKLSVGYSDGLFSVSISASFCREEKRSIALDDEEVSLYKKLSKRFVKNTLYDYLSENLGVNLPYGSLTGVRPTKLLYELMDAETDPTRSLMSDFRVSRQRAELLADVVLGQKGIYAPSLKSVDIFVNIPICPTRCAYCSFISSEIGRVKKLLPAYADTVVAETELIKTVIREKGLGVRSIYVGGGTPTSIGAEYLDRILSPLKDFCVEFTVEAGRPDTLDNKILDVMRKNNVTRISVNPQTFNEKTLEKIGRTHTVAQTINAYINAKCAGFDVNMDLIAMLPGETLEDFSYSINEATGLNPDNITVHTLSIKRGSVMKDAHDFSENESGSALAMLDYAYKALYENHYRPYYLYRQKNMADNLENTGFCLPGKACIYNIDMMEETNTILGAGAGAMTKLFYEGSLIVRHSNSKNIKEYIERGAAGFSKKFVNY